MNKYFKLVNLTCGLNTKTKKFELNARYFKNAMNVDYKKLNPKCLDILLDVQI